MARPLLIDVPLRSACDVLRPHRRLWRRCGSAANERVTAAGSRPVYPRASPTPTNAPPTISGTPQTSATRGVPYHFAPVASDANNDPLTFTVAHLPSWAVFSTSTGELDGMPTSGTFEDIVISVSDGQDRASLAPFTIRVADAVKANSPPSITGSPPTTVAAGQRYSFLPGASDTDGDPLTFSVSNPPAWATFSPGTGELSGTPSAANVGTFVDVVIRVSDGMDEGSLPAFHDYGREYRSEQRAAGDLRQPTDHGEGRANLQLHADRERSGWQPADLRRRESAVLGSLQRGERQDRRYAHRESRRGLRQRHDQRERRADERVARGVQDRRGPGHEQQFAADDSGHPVYHGDHGPSLCVHADRDRRRRRFADLHCQQPARMGHPQYIDWPDQRHAVHGQRRDIQQHPNSRERRPSERVARAVQHHGSVGESRTRDHRQSRRRR